VEGCPETEKRNGGPKGQVGRGSSRADPCTSRGTPPGVQAASDVQVKQEIEAPLTGASSLDAG
jgi:hypothetical protein